MLLVLVVRVGGGVSKLVVGVVKVVVLQLRTIEKRSQSSLSIGEKRHILGGRGISKQFDGGE